MKRTFILFCTFSFLFHLPGFFQISKIDSLRLKLKNAQHDTTRLSAYQGLGLAFHPINKDTSLYYFLRAKTLSEKYVQALKNENSESDLQLRRVYRKKYVKALLAAGRCYAKNDEFDLANKNYETAMNVYWEDKDTLLITRTCVAIGTHYIQLDRMEQAQKWVEEGLKLRLLLGNKKDIANSYLTMGHILHRTGNMSEALHAYEKSLTIMTALNDKQGTAEILSNMGVMYTEQGDYQDAIGNFTKGLELLTVTGDKAGIADMYTNIGSTYYVMHLDEKASNFLKRSLKLKLELGDDRLTAESYLLLAHVYSSMNSPHLAEENLRHAIRLSEKTGVKYMMCSSYAGAADVYEKCGRTKEAIAYARRSLVIAKDIGYPYETQTAADLLQRLNTQIGNYKEAYEMFELAKEMNDSIANESQRKASYKSKLKYEYSKKVFADSVKMADEKKIAQARISESDSRLKKERIGRFALMGGLSFTLLFTVILFNRFKLSQKQKALIEDQKSFVEAEQNKIIESINYAKKIQDSILPSSEEISGYFPKHFIFFRPKDIVSGDFYWVHHQNDISFIAVADCTGHGVPGAFMTMIANAALVETVIEKKIHSPENILTSLHELIYKNLQQHKGGEYSQDGMDLSLAVIDHKTNILQFSGARNHGYLLEEDQVLTLKADPRSIGGSDLLEGTEKNRNFKKEIYQLKKGALLVLTTDGIIDQLSEKDEKFGYGNFKGLIRKLRETEYPEELIAKELNDWKNNVPQLDDILVLGISI
jgi:serine phosphatase RsbU (regulator of sigma subunit)/Tfp pilus assembly protein PilF